MITQRFSPPMQWNGYGQNRFFLGFLDLIKYVTGHLKGSNNTMIEIGSYMGESTSLFAATKAFSRVFAVEPFQGTEEFNDLLRQQFLDKGLSCPYGNSKDEIWTFVYKLFKENTKHHKEIRLLKNYSYEVVDSFVDKSIELIYIDADHEYDSVKRDLELFLPKVCPGGIIAGHDYHEERWPGVVQAVNELVGLPDKTFDDLSWAKVL